MASAMGSASRRARSLAPWGAPHTQPCLGVHPRHLDRRTTGERLAVDHPNRAGSGRVLRLRASREHLRLPHHQHRPSSAPSPDGHRWRRDLAARQRTSTARLSISREADGAVRTECSYIMRWQFGVGRDRSKGRLAVTANSYALSPESVPGPVRGGAPTDHEPVGSDFNARSLRPRSACSRVLGYSSPGWDHSMRSASTRSR